MRIGIDVGGTNLAAGLVNDDGKIIHRASTPAEPEQGYEAMLDKLAFLCEELEDWADKNVPSDKVTEIGAGIPGIMDRTGEVVVNAPNIFWKNVPLKEDLQNRTNLPVYLANDATVAGIAENRFGSTKGKENAVMYTLGTGVGGSLIVHGKIVNGAHGVATEFGHMLHGDNFYSCNCGKNGCLETYASATALIRKAQQLIESGKKSVILDKARGDIKKINAKMVIDAAKEGDEVGLLAFNQLIEKLSDSIANTVDFLDPDVFTIGGGVSNAGDFLFDALKEAAQKKITYPELVDVDIRKAELGNDAGIIGAAYIGDYQG